MAVWPGSELGTSIRGLGFHVFAQRGVDFAHACLQRNSPDIRSADAAAGHDPDAIAGLLSQLCNPCRASHCIGFAAGSENAVGPARNHIFQRSVQICGDIECAMKRDVERPRHFNKIAHARNVNSACFGQERRGPRRRPAGFRFQNVIVHDRQFMVGIHKVAAAGTNDNEHIDSRPRREQR